jgi:hypothetical protein
MSKKKIINPIVTRNSNSNSNSIYSEYNLKCVRNSCYNTLANRIAYRSCRGILELAIRGIRLNLKRK